MAETTDRKEMLRAAWNAAQDDDEGAPPTEETAAEPAAEEEPAAIAEAAESEGAEEPPKSAEGRDQRGRFTAQPQPKDGAPPAPKPKVATPARTAAPAAAPAASTATTAAPAEPPKSDLRPPQSWTPAEREQWAGLKPEAQRAILRTEGETKRVLQENAQLRQHVEQAKKTGGEFREVVAPFEHAIRQRGAEPRQFVASLLQAEHVLATGQPHQRGDALARLVVQYGRDLLQPDRQDANGQQSSPLDRALVALMSGQAPQTPQHQPPPREPQMDVRALLREELSSWAQQAQQRNAESALQKFEATGPEFLDPDRVGQDLVNEMWANMEAWTRAEQERGRNPSPEQAYAAACRMSDTASGILQRRAEAAAVTQPSATAPTARARAAASTVRSRPASVQSGSEVDLSDRRAVIQQMVDRRR